MLTPNSTSRKLKKKLCSIVSNMPLCAGDNDESLIEIPPNIDEYRGREDMDNLMLSVLIVILKSTYYSPKINLATDLSYEHLYVVSIINLIIVISKNHVHLQHRNGCDQ